MVGWPVFSYGGFREEKGDLDRLDLVGWKVG